MAGALRPLRSGGTGEWGAPEKLVSRRKTTAIILRHKLEPAAVGRRRELTRLAEQLAGPLAALASLRISSESDLNILRRSAALVPELISLW